MPENLFGEEVKEERTLDLVVSKFNLGELATNAQIVLATVKEKIKGYSADRYSEDNIDEAKRDKAELNNAAKVLNDKKIELKKKWLKPFEDAFENPVLEAIGEIKTGSSKIDSVVKEVEDKARQAKRAAITEFFNAKQFELFTLDRIFNAAWLNKTYKMKDIEAEIEAKIKQTESELATLEKIGEPDAKAYYLSTLNLQAALEKADEIKRNRERLAEIERKKQEAIMQEKLKPETSIPVMNPEPKPEAVSPIPELTIAPNETVQLFERRFMVRGTREQIVALGEYMNSQGIYYEKIEG